jgi:hypothetical protein
VAMRISGAKGGSEALIELAATILEAAPRNHNLVILRAKVRDTSIR